MNTKLILSLLSALAALPAAAATRSWDGGDASSNWSAQNNWNPNAAISAGDYLTFPAGVAAADKTLMNNFAANTIFAGLRFNEGGYTLNGSVLDLNQQLALEAYHDSGTTTINAGIRLRDLSEWGGIFNLYGNGTVRFAPASTLNLNGAGVALQMDSAGGTFLMEGGITGAGSIHIGDSGTVKIKGAKSFTGNYHLDHGSTLEVDHAGAFQPAAPGSSTISGRLLLNSAVPIVTAEQFEMNTSAGTWAMVESTGANHVLSGELVISQWLPDVSPHYLKVSSHSLEISGPILYGGIVGAAGPLIKNGPGTLLLSGSGSNNMDNTMRVEEGTLRLQKTSGVDAIRCGHLSAGNSSGGVNTARIELMNDDQIHDLTDVSVSSDGIFVLNGHDETIRHLFLEAPGGASTGGGKLSLRNLAVTADVTATDSAQLDGALVLRTGAAVWQIHEGLQGAPELHATCNLSSPAPYSSLSITGDGDLEFYGVHTINRITYAGSGDFHVACLAPQTDLGIESGTMHGGPAVHDFEGTGGVIELGANGGHGLMVAHTTTLTSPAFFKWSCTSAADNQHDEIHTTAVALNFPGLAVVPVGVLNVSPGDELMLIRNDGNAPVAGQFLNLPEGSLVSGQYLLSYEGGDGNDVTLTFIVPPTGVSRIWDGGSAGDSNWMTAANWNPNGVPQPGDDLIFPTSAARKNNSNNFPAGTTFHSITVHGTGYGISGSGIVLNEKLEFTSASGNHVWAAPLTLALDVTVSITGNAFVQCGTPLETNGKTLTLHNAGGGTGDLYFSGAISGSGDVRKTGPGRITFFDHAHTYTGHTTVAEGTLALSYQATLGASGPDSSTTIQAQGTLELRNNEDAIACSESITFAGHGGTIRDNGGTFAAQINGPLSINEGGEIETQGDMLSLNGPVSGSGTWSKRGSGMLTIGGVSASPFNGSLLVYAGNVRLQKAFSPALNGDIAVALDGVPASVTLAGANQVADHVTVSLWPSGTFDLATHSDTIATLRLRGGLLTGTPASRLTLSAVTVVEGATATGVIAAPIAHTAGGNGMFNVFDGPATPDLRIESIVSGTTFEKLGAGRVDFMTNIPQAGLDLLDIKQGSALIFANCRYTDIALNGGLLGGNGTVGNIDSLTGGVISPGASPGALGGYKATWNAATTLRMELNGPGPGTEYDQYFANGTPDLGGAKLELSTGFDPAPGAEFMIVRNVSGEPVAGTFANAPEGGYVSAPGAKVFQITYTGGDGDDVMLTRIITTAPEIVEFQLLPPANATDDPIAHMVFKGLPGLTYLLESSTDLDKWEPVKSEVASFPQGLITLDLAEPAGTPRKFYRLRLP